MSLNASYGTTTPAFRLTDAPTTGVALPASDPSQYGNRPLAAFLQAVTHDIRFTTDGSAPTSSHGMVLTAGADPFFYAGPLTELRFIQAASGSVLNVVYSADNSAKGAQGSQGAVGAQGARGASGTNGVPSVAIDIGALNDDGSGVEIIPSPGANAFILPGDLAVIGTDSTAGMSFGWASNELIGNFDSDTGFRFTGGRFTYSSKFATQAITSVNPIDSPYKIFITNGYPAATSILDAGSGYVIGDTVKDPFSGTFLATITGIGALGIVTSYTVTNHGTEGDYTVGDNGMTMVNTAPQSGAGSGLKLNVDTLSGQAGATLIYFYQIISA